LAAGSKQQAKKTNPLCELLSRSDRYSS
jgi:hypothetical protein